jgi:hypothetical protein
VNAQQLRNVTRADTLGHQQKRLGPLQHARLGLRGTNGRFDPMALL